MTKDEANSILFTIDVIIDIFKEGSAEIMVTKKDLEDKDLGDFSEKEIEFILHKLRPLFLCDVIAMLNSLKLKLNSVNWISTSQNWTRLKEDSGRPH